MYESRDHTSSCPSSEVPQVIAPSLGRRYSGINASMLAVIPEQSKSIPIVATGFHIDHAGVRKISLNQMLKIGRQKPWKIWHARRNIDMLIGLILAKWFRCKLILLFTSAAQRDHSWITRFYYYRMEQIICPTSAAASFLKKEAVVIPHGVDTTRFQPPENRALEWKKRNLPGQQAMGIFGRVRPGKGTREFVEAAIQTLEKRPDWTAVIIGETTPKNRTFQQELRELIRNAGLEERIIFTGFLADADEIPKWYQTLSIVVCASHNEGFGLPCLEAMASGCAVVATETGAWPEVIDDDQNGYLIPIKDPNALSTRLATLMDHPQKIEALGKEAISTIHSRYKIENEAEGLNAVYRQLLARHN